MKFTTGVTRQKMKFQRVGGIHPESYLLPRMPTALNCGGLWQGRTVVCCGAGWDRCVICCLYIAGLGPCPFILAKPAHVLMGWSQ
jgi:hypothetical protein